MYLETGSFQDVIDLHRFDNHFEQTTALLHLLAKADKSTLKDYLVQSKKLTTFHLRKQVQSRILQRLSVLDPKFTLSLVERELSPTDRLAFLPTIFAEWSSFNLMEAIHNAKNLEMESRETVAASIVLTRNDLSIKERRDIAHQIGCEWVAINLLCDESETSIFDDPEQAWYEIVEMYKSQFSTLSDIQTQALGHIFLAWIKLEGLEIIDAVQESLPTSFSLSETITFVTDQLLDTRPKLALSLALEMASKLEHSHSYRYLARDIADRWAESEPRQALDATFKVDGRSLRRMLQDVVLSQWANRDPLILLENIDTLPADIEVLIRQHALIAISATAPENVVDMLDDFSIRKNRDIVAAAIVRNWVKTDVSKLFDWIETDRNVSHIQNELKRHAFVELTREAPAIAMQEAVSRPPDHSGVGWEASVITRLVMSGDVDSAVALLPKVRDGKTKTRAYSRVIEHLIDEKYDTNLAIDLFLQLDQSEITKASYLINDLTQLAPEHFYKKLNKLEPINLRVYAATLLHSNNQQNRTFTSKELKAIEEIMNSTD
ncbi:MAG: hypothetical protein F4W92_00685 [Gammaproteobacteria bacterium]|nr:hypothetical protein [Gammaproteobacteria bacterium]